jgi:hypothetical protein
VNGERVNNVSIKDIAAAGAAVLPGGAVAIRCRDGMYPWLVSGEFPDGSSLASDEEILRWGGRPASEAAPDLDSLLQQEWESAETAPLAHKGDKIITRYDDNFFRLLTVGVESYYLSNSDRIRERGSRSEGVRKVEEIFERNGLDFGTVQSSEVAREIVDALNNPGVEGE